MEELSSMFKSYDGNYGLGYCCAGHECINNHGTSLTSQCFHYDRNSNPIAKYTCEYCKLTIHQSCIFHLLSINNNMVCNKCGSETMPLPLPSKLNKTQRHNSKSLNENKEIESLLQDDLITDPDEETGRKSLLTTEDYFTEPVKESNKKNNNLEKSKNDDTDDIVNDHREQFEISVFGTKLSPVNSQEKQPKMIKHPSNSQMKTPQDISDMIYVVEFWDKSTNPLGAT